MLKKLSFFFVFLFFLTFTGCSFKAEDYKPVDYNKCSTKKVGWDIWAKGTIKETGIKRSPTCDKKPICPPDCTKHGSYFFAIIDDKRIMIHNVLNPGEFTVGSNGVLYRHNVGQSNEKSWFQWIEKKPKETEQPISTIISKYEWVLRTDYNPERYIPVLMKFKNKTLAIGYINNLNEWKLSINTNVEDGGETIYNLDIMSWKNIDTN